MGAAESCSVQLCQRRRLTSSTSMMATRMTWVVLGVKVAGWPKMACGEGLSGGGAVLP